MNRHVSLRFSGGAGRPEADRANALLERWERSAERGVCPIKPHLTPEVLKRAADNRFDASGPLAERVRWLDAQGRFRPKTLSREALVEALRKDHGLDVAAASQMASDYSGALETVDMDWLIARDRADPATRPLDGGDYAALAGAVDALAGDCPLVADAVACRLGQAFDVYQPAPFSNERLAASFRKAHAAHLQSLRNKAQRAYENVIASTSVPDAVRSELRERRKAAEMQVSLAEHAVDGVLPSPSHLTLTLETADGRVVWCHVWKCMGASMSRCSSFEAQVFEREDTGEQTLRFSIDVGYDDDGHSNRHFEGTGDEWRFLESNGLEDAVFQRLLAGDRLPEVLEDLMSPETPVMSAM